MRFAAPAAVAIAAVAAIAGCGGKSGNTSQSSPRPSQRVAESSPPGDIPDNQAYVAYTPPRGGYSVKVPEGWARTTSGSATSFTDKLNTVTVESQSAASALTVTSARHTEAPRLARGAQGFRLLSVSTIKGPVGRVVHLSYLVRSAPDAVTGKSTVDAVERYVFFHNGKRVTLTLSGAKTADNVDPWRIIWSSLRWK